MAEFSEFRSFVRLEIPSAPLPVIDNALLRSAQEFCRRTGIYTFQQDAFNTIANEPEYQLEPETGTIVDRVLSIMVNGVAIGPGRTQDFDVSLGDWRNADPGLPENYYFDTHNILRFRPVPDGAYEVLATLVLSPAPDAVELPDVLLKYTETIGFGALYRLLEISGKPWTNPSMANSYKGQYEREITNTGASANKRGTTLSLRAAPVKFV